MHPNRRRFLIASDDEGEDGNAPTPAPLVRTIFGTPSPNPNPNPSPLQISDDDISDIPETIISSPGPNCPIKDFLSRLGVRPRREWLDACIAALASSRPGFANLDVAQRAQLCFAHFLYSDMNLSGGGVLPLGVHAMHCVELAGPFVLQVDEIVNISSPLRDRYQGAHAGIKRCLKLSITDGSQRVFGMEYRPVKDLEVFSPAGLKICLRNVQIRRGLLMLVPEVLDVLGGSVDDLDAARRRVVEEVNKPPRGKRTRTGDIPPLATRARLAAWPCNANCGSVQGNVPPVQLPNLTEPINQGASSVTSGSNTGFGAREESSLSRQGSDGRATLVTSSVDAGSSERGACAVSIGEGVVEHVITSNTYSEQQAFAAAVCIGGGRTPHCRTEAETIPSLHNVSNIPSATSATGPETFFSIHDNLHFNNVEDVQSNEAESPPMLDGGKEIPFTYLASMRAKLIAEQDLRPIRGKIKCFLTGVKGFQFKRRSKFELNVYVDDGSLISEVLISHDVVQKGIGHSPEEVSTALSSQDKQLATAMRETMQQYQVFLRNFEGMMLVELKSLSAVPLVLEMTQGCSSLDAWLLLERLKSFTPRTRQHSCLNPIDISP